MQAGESGTTVTGKGSKIFVGLRFEVIDRVSAETGSTRERVMSFVGESGVGSAA